MGKYIFLGTDTGVGKTLVMAASVVHFYKKGIRAAPFKPVQSGGVRDAQGKIIYTDADVLSLATGNTLLPDVIAPWTFEEEVAPFILLEESGGEIPLESVIARWEALVREYDVVLFEGAGGVAVPLFGNVVAADFIKLLGLVPVVVARAGLGTINHTLLTLEYLRHRKIEPLGVVLTENSERLDPSKKKNPEVIERLGNVRILGIVPYMGDYSNSPPPLDDLEQIGERFSISPDY